MADIPIKTTTTAYESTVLDKAFVQVISYLVEHKRHIPGVWHTKQLLGVLGIRQCNFIEIKNGTRGVPKRRADEITKILVNEYAVNAHYLRTGTGHICQHAAQNDNALLQQRIHHLEALLQQKDETITALQRHLRHVDQQFA